MVVSKEIELKYPIEIEGKNGGKVEVSTLKLTRLKLKHCKLLPDDFVERNGNIEPADFIPLIAGLANISEDEAGEIDFADIQNLSEAISSFLADTQGETGKS